MMDEMKDIFFFNKTQPFCPT